MNDINLTNDKKLEIIEKVINAKGFYGLLEELEKMKPTEEIIESIPPTEIKVNYEPEINEIVNDSKPSIYSERGFEALSSSSLEVPSEGKRLVKTNSDVKYVKEETTLPNNFSDAVTVSPGYMNR